MEYLAQQLDRDLSKLVECARPALVEIRNGRGGAGAGTVWHEQGLIVTNAHVVGRGAVSVRLFDGRTLPARLLAIDEEADLAALAVDASGLPVIPLGNSDALHPGQWLVALGHPWGVPGAATAGVFIGNGMDGYSESRNGHSLLAVQMRLRPGHSGGPLLNTDGQLVGINMMMQGLQVGVAVPVQAAKRFLRDRLMA